jgi:hypothetical protein
VKLTGQRVIAIWGTMNLLLVVMIYAIGESGIDSGLYVSAVVIVYLFAFGLFLVDRTRPPSAPLRRMPSSGAAALLLAIGIFVVSMGAFFGLWLAITAPVIVAVSLLYLWMWARTGNSERPLPLVQQPGEAAATAAPPVSGSAVQGGPPAAGPAGSTPSPRPRRAPARHGPAPLPVVAGTPLGAGPTTTGSAGSEGRAALRSGEEQRPTPPRHLRPGGAPSTGLVARLLGTRRREDY